MFPNSVSNVALREKKKLIIGRIKKSHSSAVPLVVMAKKIPNSLTCVFWRKGNNKNAFFSRLGGNVFLLTAMNPCTRETLHCQQCIHLIRAEFLSRGRSSFGWNFSSRPPRAGSFQLCLLLSITPFTTTASSARFIHSASPPVKPSSCTLLQPFVWEEQQDPEGSCLL